MDSSWEHDGTHGTPWDPVGTRGNTHNIIFIPRDPTESHGIPQEVSWETVICRGGISWHPMIRPQERAGSYGSSDGIPPKRAIILLHHTS